MANRYWVGGTGTWSTTSTTNWSSSSGGGGGASVPTSADSVFFDANSNTGTGAFTVTCSSATGTLACLDFTASGLDGVMTFAGTSGTLYIYGSMSLPASNFTFTRSFSSSNGTLNFASTTTGKTITTNGVDLSTGSIYFSGIGGGWTLGSALTCASLNSEAGTFSTGASNYTLNATRLRINGGTVSLNASTVNLSEADNGFTSVFQYDSGTFNAGTSQINFTNAAYSKTTDTDALTIAPGGVTFYNVAFTGSNSTYSFPTIDIKTSATFNNLSFASLGTTFGNLAIVVPATGITVNGILTFGTTNSGNKRMFVNSDAIGFPATITHNGTLATMTDVDFRDIVKAGTASTWSGTRIGDCGNNSGITFSTTKTVYWVLTAGGTWGTSTGWSTTSGGASSVNNFPLPQDNAIIDDTGLSALSAIAVESGGSVFGNTANWNISKIDSSSKTTAWSLGLGNSTTSTRLATTITNDLILTNGYMTNPGPNVFYARSGTIAVSGSDLTFNGTSSVSSTSYTFTLTNQATTVRFDSDIRTQSTTTLTAGTIDANNYNISTGRFVGTGSGTRTLTMGSGTWTIRGQSGTIWDLTTTTNLTFNKGSANIVFSDGNTNSKTFAGGGLTYNGLQLGASGGVSGTQYIITGSNTFSSISSLRTLAYSIRLTDGTTQTVASFTASGSSGNLLTLQSATAGTAATINGTSGTVNYALITDVNLSSANTLVAANSTVINSNNWTIATTSKSWRALTTGTSWTAPSDWSSTGNELHVIGGGGGAAGAITTLIAGGGGGGGAGYAGKTNLTITPSTSYTYAIGAAGTGGTGSTTTSTGGAGGTSSITIGSTTYTATGGTGGAATSTPTSTAGSGGTGSTISPPTYVNSAVSVQTTNSTTITVTVPSGISNGNLLVMVLNNDNITSNWTTPSGWTAAAGNNSNGRGLFYRTASSEPASYVLTQSGSARSDAFILAYANAAWDTTGLASQTAASPITPVAITVGTTNSTIVYVAASSGTASVTYTTPTGYTARASDSDGSTPSAAIFDLIGVASGSYTGPSTTPSSGNARAFTISLSPVSSTTGITAYTGGAGAVGATSGITQRMGGGGGGSAGPNGNGGNGAAGAGGTGAASGGGGGNGGGTNASGITGGTGFGSGLGGAGGIGTTSVAGTGTAPTDGLEIVLGYYGSGGGGTGAGSNSSTTERTGANYGAGGGGPGATSSATARTGGSGAQGIIIVGFTGTYVVPISGGNFLNFF